MCIHIPPVQYSIRMTSVLVPSWTGRTLNISCDPYTNAHTRDSYYSKCVVILIKMPTPETVIIVNA